jgi:hypothetical protein
VKRKVGGTVGTHTHHSQFIFKILPHLGGTKKLAVQLIMGLLDEVRWRNSSGELYRDETRRMTAILGSDEDQWTSQWCIGI